VEGDAWLLVYRVGSQIEMTVTEEKGGDSSVLLSKEQARELARALTAALDNPKNPSTPVSRFQTEALLGDNTLPPD
jgi:hypothetical protein